MSNNDWPKKTGKRMTDDHDDEQVAKPKKASKLRANWDTIVMQLLIDILGPIFGDKLKAREITIDDAMDTFFNVDEREVYHARVTKPFHLAGDHWLSTTTRSINTGSRYLRKDQRILLRVDRRDNGAVDVQLKLQDETDQMFSLTQAQWHAIKDSVIVTYQAILTGKEATRARHLKLYHTEFVRANLGCGFEYRTASGLVRPGYKGTKA